jgi:hypothetical protein
MSYFKERVRDLLSKYVTAEYILSYKTLSKLAIVCIFLL